LLAFHERGTSLNISTTTFNQNIKLENYMQAAIKSKNQKHCTLSSEDKALIQEFLLYQKRDGLLKINKFITGARLHGGIKKLHPESRLADMQPRTFVVQLKLLATIDPDTKVDIKRKPNGRPQCEGRAELFYFNNDKVKPTEESIKTAFRSPRCDKQDKNYNLNKVSENNGIFSENSSFEKSWYHIRHGIAILPNASVKLKDKIFSKAMSTYLKHKDEDLKQN